MTVLLEVVYALVKCYALILFGVLAGRRLPDYSPYVLFWLINYLLLPSLIVSAILTIDFSQINHNFLGAVFVGKTLVFILIVTLTLSLTQIPHLGKAALFGIAVTQSNDFAFGRALLASIFSSHLYEKYIFFLAPIQLLIINPVAFILLEFQKNNQNDNFHLWSFLKGLFGNPIVLATLISFVANLTFKNSIPSFIIDFTGSIGMTFDVAALFLLGVTMSGVKFHLSALSTSLLLTVAKIIVLPLVLSKAVLWMMKDTQLSNFAFVYGTFPSAPSLLIFALQYNMDSNVVSCTLVLTTALCAPLLLIASQVLHLTPSLTERDIIEARYWISLISMVALSLLLLLFLLNWQWRSVTHRITMCLAVAQLLLALGGFLSLKWCLTGFIAVKLWTVVLALIMYLLHHRSFCYALIALPYLIWLGLLAPVIIGLLYAFLSSLKSSAVAFPSLSYTSIAMCVMDGLCLCFTSFFLVLHWRKQQQKREEEKAFTAKRSFAPSAPQDSCDIEDLATVPLLCNERYNCSSQQRKHCHLTLSHHICDPDPQLTRHLVFLLLLITTTFLSFFQSIGNLALDPSTGILVGLSYVNILLPFGQGLITFFCFGVQKKLWLGIIDRIWSMSFCIRFIKGYRSECISQICFGQNQFRKPDLLSWLTEVGLAKDDQDSEWRVRQLVQGNIISPITEILYKFL